MVTCSLAEYEARALALARAPAALAAIRAKLARNRDTHPLFDARRFTRHVEKAYARMWERYCDGAPPVAFAVDAVE
jgi:predicted O-linked N-acetylglucosamine transferase (SPINDLY family)